VTVADIPAGYKAAPADRTDTVAAVTDMEHTPGPRPPERGGVRVERIDDPRFAALATAPPREYGLRIDPAAGDPPEGDEAPAAPPPPAPPETPPVVAAPVRDDVRRARRAVHRLVAVGLAVPVLVVAVLGAVVITSDNSAPALPPAPPPVHPPPAFTIATAISARAPAAPGMAVAAAANGGLWYQRTNGLLTRLAADNGAINYAFTDGAPAAALAVAGRSLLVVARHGDASTLTVRDRGTGAVLQRVPLPGPPACTPGMPAGCAPVTAGGQIFVPLQNGLARVRDGVATLTPLPRTLAAVVGVRHIWVVTADALLTVDPVADVVRARAALHGLVPSAVTSAAGTVWVAGTRDGRPMLLRFGRPAGGPATVIQLPAPATALAAADGAIWVGLAGGGIHELAPSGGTLAGATIDLPEQTELLTARPDQLWAVRIGPTRARFTRIDLTPAGS
jgi:hypothetical protein